jgi:hypothetical protein
MAPVNSLTLSFADIDTPAIASDPYCAAAYHISILLIEAAEWHLNLFLCFPRPV